MFIYENKPSEDYRNKYNVFFIFRFNESTRETLVSVGGPKKAKYIRMNYYD